MANIVGDSTWQGDNGGVHAWTKFKRPPNDCRKGYFLCKACGYEIVHVSNIKDQFASSLAEKQTQVAYWPKTSIMIQHFTNPSGVGYDVITTNQANATRISGEYKEHSLWPGYNWMILGCPKCKRHVGWEYTKTNKDDVEEMTFCALVINNLVYENDYLSCKCCGRAAVHKGSVVNIPTEMRNRPNQKQLGNIPNVLVQLFQNPREDFYDVVTFKQAVANRCGAATIEHTWWHNFKWVVLRCVQCNAHIGWEYVPTKANKKPFVGLILDHLLHGDVSLSRSQSLSSITLQMEKCDLQDSNDYFCCKKCTCKIFHKSKVVVKKSPMAVHLYNANVGPIENVLIQRFKNPHGFEFDVVTVSEASVFRSSGEHEECTWWSDFNWVILECPHCKEHIGWEYLLAKRNDTANCTFFGFILEKLQYNNGCELPRYKMDRKPRGFCLIINNMDFGDPKRYRHGSDKDEARLVEVFEKKLQFKKIVESDQTSEQMKTVLKRLAAEDHTLYDCFVCCILSHGGTEEVSGVNDKNVSIKKITSYFKGDKCRTLVGKPKLFFIQTCQGGTEVQTDHSLPMDKMTSKKTKIVPDDADVLIGYATSSGYSSFRSRSGSYYIQTLCNSLEKHALSGRYDILKLLTMVNREVSEQDISYGKVICKQMPSPKYTLTKQLFFE